MFNIIATPKFQPNEVAICRVQTNPEQIVKALLKKKISGERQYLAARYEFVDQPAGAVVEQVQR